MNYEETINGLRQLFGSTNHEKNCNKQKTFEQLLQQLTNYYKAFAYEFFLNLAIETIPLDVEDRGKEIEKATKRTSQYLRKAIKNGYLIKEQFCKGVVEFRVLKGETTELLIPFRNIKEVLEISGLISKPERYNYLGNPKDLALWGFRQLFQ